MFWALEQWKNQRARDRAEGFAEGVRDVLKFARPHMTKDEYDAILERLKRDGVINSNDLAALREI